jgi:hypothetical protein
MRMPGGLPDDVDDTSVPLSLHLGQHGACHAKEAKDLVVQLPLQLLFSHIVKRGTHMRARVVDEDVDTTEAGENSVSKGIARRCIGRIGSDCENCFAKLPKRLFRRFEARGVATTYRNTRTL